mmetsp:Transcript_8349/g.17008  ORF Transcript_8349/g.17008 Transcript_8349/m.17008 type:complete len:212 (-) Transcript_8349:807-1442(-)
MNKRTPPLWLGLAHPLLKFLCHESTQSCFRLQRPLRRAAWVCGGSPLFPPQLSCRGTSIDDDSACRLGVCLLEDWGGEEAQGQRLVQAAPRGSRERVEDPPRARERGGQAPSLQRHLAHGRVAEPPQVRVYTNGQVNRGLAPSPSSFLAALRLLGTRLVTQVGRVCDVGEAGRNVHHVARLHHHVQKQVFLGARHVVGALAAGKRVEHRVG